MPVDLRTIQLFTLAILFAMLYGGRMVKGKPRESAEGLAFPLKPIVVWSRAIVLPLYFALFAWPAWKAHHSIPLWFLLLIVALVALILYQMPSTIVLTPTAVIQRFWLRGTKTIQYGEVMSIQMIGAGRMTRVLGDNRVSITHTWNHSAAEEFRRELERRTGKRVIR